MEDEEGEVESIARTIHRKTNGNPFFVLAFLRSLYDEQLLEYSFAIERWRWDDDRVEQMLMTENVASIMANKLTKFEASAQTLLKIASCLGASFSLVALSTVVKKSTSEDIRSSFEGDADIDNTILLRIGEFEDEGLLERDTAGLLHFAHDQIQSSANALIPEDERNSFKGDVGKTLMENLDASLLEANLFDVVSLCNCSSDSLSVLERHGLGLMNLRAGMTASNAAAFDTACVYFEAARKLLRGMSWEDDRDLMVKLYIAEANARFVMGELGIVESLVNKLLSHSNEMPLWDRFKAIEVKILAVQAANRFDEAISLALDLRKELGFKAIPTRVSKLKVISEYLKTNRAIKGRSAEELTSLPNLGDERVIIGQRMLDLLRVSTYQANPSMYPLVVFTQLQQTIKTGIDSSSIQAFVGFGILLCGIFGDLKRGREMGKAAELVLDRPTMKRMRSRACYPLEGMIYHWTAPLQSTLQPMLNGYLCGLETGDTESAGWNICLRCCFSWFASRPLNDLKSEISTAVSVIDQINAIGAKYCTLPFLQAVHNLLEEGSATPWVLSGDAMDFEETLLFAKKTSNEMVRAYSTIVQLDLFVMFQRWDAATLLLTAAGDLRPIIPGLYHVVRFTFLEGLISLKAAQLSRSWRERRRWTRRANATMKMMRSWMKKGNVNVLPTWHLLSAECSVLKGRNKQAEESFKAAARVASRNGFRYDKALSHELAGMYFTERGDKFWAEHNLTQAHKTSLSRRTDIVVKCSKLVC